MRSLLDGDLFDLRCSCGITVPSKNLKFKDLLELIRSLCLHFVIYTAKSELDQLREGLEVLNLLSVMQSNSTLFMPLFVGSNRPQLTADSLLGLFKVKSWSPAGSNSRECEEAVIFNWENYVRETEGRGMLLWFYCQPGMHLKYGQLVISMDTATVLAM